MKKAIVMMVLAGTMLFGSAVSAAETTVTAIGSDMFVVVREGGDRIDLYEIREGKIMILDAVLMEREDVRHRDLPDFILRRFEVENKEE